jgi:hypothetical protein
LRWEMIWVAVFAFSAVMTLMILSATIHFAFTTISGGVNRLIGSGIIWGLGLFYPLSLKFGNEFLEIGGLSQLSLVSHLKWCFKYL